MQRTKLIRSLVLGAGLSVSWLALACGGGGSSSPPPPPPVVSITISPTSLNLLTGATQQFSASVLNTSNIAVTWSAGGVTGGNATVGTISAGLYIAPAAVPSPSSVTVTATSQADTTKSASATVTIIAPAPPAQTVTVTAGQTTSGVDVAPDVLTPALDIIALGTCNNSGNCSAGAVGVQVARGSTATLFLVGKGVGPGVSYSFSGNSADVTINQSSIQFCTTTTNEPCVSFDISVSASAPAGPRNVMVSSSHGELAALVGGLLITGP